MQSDQLNNFQKPELERSILSSLMVDPDEFFRHEIQAEIFTEKRKTVFETIKSLIESGVKPDLLTVKNDINDKDFIQELVSIASAPVSVNPEYYIQELKTARKRHDLYNTLTLTRDMCLNGLKLEDIESKLRTNIASAETHEPQKTLDILTRLIEEIEKEATGQVEKGVKTGIQTLDYMTNGFSPGDIVTIAARPGMGKSSLAMNMVRNFSFFDVPGMVFSLEMKADALMRRMICDIGGVDSCYLFQNQLRKDKSMWQYINDATSKISQFPIAWDDSSGLTIDRIVSRARKQKALHGLSYIVVDYVQLINGWNKDGQGPKAEIYSQFKSISKELDIFCIVLSQMNREIEKRTQKKPQMSDLRDAGCIENDSTHILFPIIDSKAAGKPRITEGNDHESAVLYLEKNRNGRTGQISSMRWQGHLFRFFDNYGL